MAVNGRQIIQIGSGNVNAHDVLKHADDDVGKILGALGLLTSTIKRGERWGPECESVALEAFHAVGRLERALATTKI